MVFFVGQQYRRCRSFINKYSLSHFCTYSIIWYRHRYGWLCKIFYWKSWKNNDRAKSFIGGTIQLLTIASLLCTILLYLFSEPLLRLLGADGEVLAQSKSYIDVIALGSFFQIFSTAFIPIIRNLGGAYFATITMMLGFISNIIFDYIFIWQLNLGTFGAGLATVIGQAVALIVGLMYLIKKKGITFKTYKHNLLNIWKSILKIGIAPFGLNLSPNFSLILINRFLFSTVVRRQ